MNRATFVLSALLVLPSVPSLAGDDLYYVVDGEQVDLVIDNSMIIVRDPQGRPHADVVSLMYANGFTDFEITIPMTVDNRHLLVWPSDGPSQGDPPNVIELVDDLVANPENDLYVSPVLRYDDPIETENATALVILPRLLVRFNEGTPAGVPQSVLATVPGEILVEGWLDDPNTFVHLVDSTSGFEVLDYANDLAVHPDVLWSDPHLVIDAQPSEGGSCSPVTFDPSPVANPDADQSWEIGMIDAEGAWAQCSGAPKVGDKPDAVVVIFDDGVDDQHGDIHQIPGYNFAPYEGCMLDGLGLCEEPGGQPRDECDNHGTAVAGRTAGVINNSIGSTGIAPNVPVISLRTFYYGFDDSCGAAWPGDGIDILVLCRAIQWYNDELMIHYSDSLKPSTRIVSNMS